MISRLRCCSSSCILSYPYIGNQPEQPDGFEVFSNASVVDTFPLVVAMDVEDSDAVERMNRGCEVGQVARVGEA